MKTTVQSNHKQCDYVLNTPTIASFHYAKSNVICLDNSNFSRALANFYGQLQIKDVSNVHSSFVSTNVRRVIKGILASATIPSTFTRQYIRCYCATKFTRFLRSPEYDYSSLIRMDTKRLIDGKLRCQF